MKIILFGSTGMVGEGVLRECLNDNQIESVLLVNRQASKVTHPKIIEIIHNDFFDLSPISNQLSGYDACIDCLGVAFFGISETDYYRSTFDLNIKVAEAVLKANKEICFSYISGFGTDSTEKGKNKSARIKGKTENALLKMPFKHAYMFRPGYIQPMNGIRSRARIYRNMYGFFKPFYFLLKHYKSMVTNTEILGKAMIYVALNGYEKKIVENKDINEIVRRK